MRSPGGWPLPPGSTWPSWPARSSPAWSPGSLGLLADAGHNLADSLAVVLALVALRLSRRVPSSRRTFGGLRWPVLAAQANAATLLVVTLWLAVEAVRRLVHPESVVR